MTDLTEASIGIFRRPGGANALAGRLGDPQDRSVIAAAEVAVPFLVQIIRHRLAEPDGGVGLAQIVGGIDPTDTIEPGEAFRSGRYVRSGQQLVEFLLATEDARDRAAGTVAEHAGLEADSGRELLSAAAWVVGAQLHLEAGSPVHAEALESVIEGGSSRIMPPSPPSALAPVIPPVDLEPPQRPDPGDALVRAGSPVAEPAGEAWEMASPALESASAPRTSPTPTLGVHPSVSVPARTPHRPKARNVPDDDFAVGSSGLVTGVAILLGLMIAGLGLWWWLSRDDGEAATSAELAEAESVDDADGDAGPEVDTATDTADGSSDDAASDGAAADGDEAADEGADQDDPADGDAGPSAPLSPIGPDGLARMSLPMIDPIGRTDATGSAELVFDPTAGEICYDIGLDGVAQPADGHIHLGPTGVKGGVVVDFGPMTDGVTGCQAVAAEEIDAILADLDGHYVELHDPVEEWTVRTQLSEGIAPDGPSLSDIAAAQNAADDSDDTDAVALFDPDGGGAVAIVEPGRIVLQGDVHDRDTAERVLIDFAGLSELLVVDELVVEDGAPLPSGRVIIDSPGEALFASNSDVLNPAVDPLVEQLIALLEARPDWNVTVVGHTDTTGDDVINLELSFRRAEAVRQELIDGGVNPDRIRVRGAGSTDPIADNDTIAGRAQNRRIEFEIER